MKSLIDKALKLARSEVANERRVMVLFPNSKWRSAALPQSEGIWLRASTVESSLKSVPIDTLILVYRKHPDWNMKGERYARGKLCTSPSPRVIDLRGVQWVT